MRGLGFWGWDILAKVQALQVSEFRTDYRVIPIIGGCVLSKFSNALPLRINGCK